VKQFLRATDWLQTADESNPMAGTVILAIDDLNVTAEEYEERMRAARPDTFSVFETFEHEGPLQRAIADNEQRWAEALLIESNQAIAYYYNAHFLPIVGQVLVNPGPTPLNVEQTSYVLRWLAEHSNYKGQNIRCYVWADDPSTATVVELADGKLLPPEATDETMPPRPWEQQL